MTSPINKSASRAIADVTGGTILATVEIAAKPERVFQALTSSTDVINWWGSPDTYRTTAWEADLRTGGKFTARGVGKQGEFSVSGEYLVVDPPHRLVHTWIPTWDPGTSTTVSYLLEGTPLGTRVTLRHEGFAGRAESCRGHTEGWQRVLGWLSAYASGKRELQYFMSRLHAPRPTFPGDMTDQERAVMHDHVAYWSKLLEEGVAVAFGPVMDPKGAWGAAIVAVSSEDELRALQQRDPVTLANLGFEHEAWLMPNAIVRE